MFKLRLRPTSRNDILGLVGASGIIFWNLRDVVSFLDHPSLVSPKGSFREAVEHVEMFPESLLNVPFTCHDALVSSLKDTGDVLCLGLCHLLERQENFVRCLGESRRPTMDVDQAPVVTLCSKDEPDAERFSDWLSNTIKEALNDVYHDPSCTRPSDSTSLQEETSQTKRETDTDASSSEKESSVDMEEN